MILALYLIGAAFTHGVISSVETPDDKLTWYETASVLGAWPYFLGIFVGDKLK